MQNQIDEKEMLSWPERYRTNFINSLWGPRTAFLVGTVNAKGTTNLSIVNSVFHLGANPMLMGLVFRPDTVERHTYRNIIDTGKFTLNVVGKDLVAMAHQTSARYKIDESEFEKCGIDMLWEDNFPAPFVKASNIKIALELDAVIPIQRNGCNIITAKPVIIILPQGFVTENGFVHHELNQTMTAIGLNAYAEIKDTAMFPYAKP
jgi:flavin reductase (DIM6/NTAB) family NADH-FMN oxidoreductase RutF